MVDAPARTPLGRLGLSTRPLVAAWAAALGLLVLVPAVPAAGGRLRHAHAARSPSRPWRPPRAVVLAYRVGSDPVGEMALATPLAGLRLVSRRALLVGAVALPVGVVAALLTGLSTHRRARPGSCPGSRCPPWSCWPAPPGSTRRTPQPDWAAPGRWPSASRPPSAGPAADVVAVHIASPTFQLTALVVALTALALTVSRRERIAYRRTA